MQEYTPLADGNARKFIATRKQRMIQEFLISCQPDEDKSRTLEEKIAAMKKEMARLKKLAARMRNAPGQQISLTDPDARSMKYRGSGYTYNVLFWNEKS